MSSTKAPSGLTGLRGIACLFVVLYHLNQQRSVENLSSLDWSLYQFVQATAVAVSFFFVLAGAFRSLPYWRGIFLKAPVSDLRNTLIDRFFRIAPAYYLALLVSFSLAWIIQSGTPETFARLFSGIAFLSWIHPSTFFPVDFNGPLWYIAYDMAGGLFVILFMTWLTRIPKRTIPLWFGAATTVLLLLHFAFLLLPFPRGDGPVYEWFPTYNPFLFGLHFLVGTLVGYGYVRREIRGSAPSWRDDLWATLSLIGLMALLFFTKGMGDFALSWPTGPYRFPFATILIALALYFLPNSVRVGKWLDNRLLAAIAKISYSVYLWHALVIVLLRRYVFAGPTLELGQWLLLCLATFPLVFAVASLSYRFVESKSMDWRKKILG